MTTWLKTASLFFALTFPFFSVASSINWDATLEGISNDVIAKNYLHFSKSAKQLNENTNILCLQPTQENLIQTQVAFKQNLADWQKVQWLNFGPTTLFMRYHSFAYWPDKKGITQRQLRQLVKTDIDDLEDDFWRSASIAVRGLTAIESILYRSDLDPLTQEKYCQLLTQISNHHQNSANDIYAEWKSGQFNDWVFADDDDEIDIKTAALEKIILQWLEHIVMVKDSKIKQPIGWDSKANVKLAEFYRSGQTLASIKQNIQIYHDIYYAGTPSLFDISRKNSPQKAEELKHALKNNIIEVNRLSQNFFDNDLSDIDRKNAAKNIITTLSNSQRKLTELVTDLGFKIGFNSRDGD